jgi:hypothetical protein
MHIVDIFLIACTILGFLMCEAFLAFFVVLTVVRTMTIWTSFVFSFGELFVNGVLTFVGLFLLLLLVAMMIGMGQYLVKHIKTKIDKHKHGYVDLG